MKKALVSHLVNAVTKYRKVVLIIFSVLFVLSLISMFLFLEIDTSFKGMAGEGIKEVDDFDKIMSDFNVSGVITVTAEPKKEVIEKVKEYKQKVDEIVFDVLNEDGKDKVISIFKSYNDENAYRLLKDKDTVEIVMEMLSLMGKQKREEILNDIGGLTKEEIRFIKKYITSSNPEKKKDVFRKLDLLSQQEIGRLVSKVDVLKGERKDKLVKLILSYLTVFDKEFEIVDTLDYLSPDEKDELIGESGKLEELAFNIDDLLISFKDRAVEFADELKKKLSSGRVIKTSYDTEELSNIVKGVLYADYMSISLDGLMYMIMVTPHKNIDDAMASIEFAETVDIVLSEVEEDFPKLVVKRTGFSVIAKDEEESALGGLGVSLIVTVIVILLIFLIGLRRVAYPLMTMLPLVIGIILMFGIFSIIVGTLNMFTMMMPVLLFGLGIDYAIHFGARYGEARGELGSDASQEDVLRETFNSIGPALFVGAVTTFFAFLALTVSVMVGLKHSGIIASVGVASAFLSVLYILPILVLWRERSYMNKGKKFNFLRSKKFTGLGRFVDSPFGIILAVFIIILAFSFIYLPKPEIETDAMEMEPEGLESVELAKEFEEKYNSSDMYTYFVLDSYEGLKEFRKEINRKLENGSKKYPTLNTEMMMSARNPIETFNKLGWEVGNLETLDKYVEKYAEKGSMMGGSSENLAKMNEFIVRNYVNWEESEYLLMVPPTGYVWNSILLNKHMEDIRRIENETGVNAVGLVEVWSFIMNNLMRDLFISSLFAFLIVIIVIFVITFAYEFKKRKYHNSPFVNILAVVVRALRGVVICSVSLLISVVATLSILSILDMKFNMINIIAFPIIIGLGIDYSVHIYFRIVRESNLNIVEAISSTGKAVLLTTLTTLAAFGSFSFSAHPGLAELGITTCIGLTMAFLSSLFVIPVLSKLFYIKKYKELKLERHGK